MPHKMFEDGYSANNEKENPSGTPKLVSVEKLKAVSGVEYYQVDINDIKHSEEYRKLKTEKGFVYEDIFVLSEKESKEDFDEKVKQYCAEHHHDDEEIRIFLEGGGYFDVRDKEDNWIRIHATKGDLLVVPRGTFHRFRPDENNHVKVLRLFSGVPVWAAEFRPKDLNRSEDLSFLSKPAA